MSFSNNYRLHSRAYGVPKKFCRTLNFLALSRVRLGLNTYIFISEGPTLLVTVVLPRQPSRGPFIVATVREDCGGLFNPSH